MSLNPGDLGDGVLQYVLTARMDCSFGVLTE